MQSVEHTFMLPEHILVSLKQLETLFSSLKVNTLQNWLTEFNLWLPPQEALSPDADPALFAGRTFKVHILNDEHKYVTCCGVSGYLVYMSC